LIKTNIFSAPDFIFTKDNFYRFEDRRQDKFSDEDLLLTFDEYLEKKQNTALENGIEMANYFPSTKRIKKRRRAVVNPEAKSFNLNSNEIIASMRKEVRERIVSKLDRLYKTGTSKKYRFMQKFKTNQEKLHELSELHRKNTVIAVKNSQLMIDFDADISAT
jgi:hypothetical protein